MKILFCDNQFYEHLLFRSEVMAHFRDLGHEVVFASPEESLPERMRLLPEGIRFCPLPMKRTSVNPFSDIRLYQRMLRLVRQERPQYMFNYTIKPNVYGALAAHRCGVTCIDVLPGLGFAFTDKCFSAWVARQLYKVGMHYAQHLIVLNSMNRDVIEGIGRLTKGKVILLEGGEGLDLQRFSYRDNQADATVFLLIGRIVKEKGYREFVEAAKRVQRVRPDAVFEVLGPLETDRPDGISQQEVEEAVEAGTIRYLGFTTDMQEVYNRKGVVVVLPSYYGEGMNRTLMEACAVGKPIITTDHPGCREMVEQGKNGFLVPVRDAGQLAEAMLAYLNLDNNGRQAMSRQSRSLAERKFDMRMVLEVYDRLIST